jgi:hypothetical protein
VLDAQRWVAAPATRLVAERLGIRQVAVRAGDARRGGEHRARSPAPTAARRLVIVDLDNVLGGSASSVRTRWQGLNLGGHECRGEASQTSAGAQRPDPARQLAIASRERRVRRR